MKFEVTVIVEGQEDFTTIVEASREGLAKTEAMFKHALNLRGELVEFTCKALGENHG